MLVKTKCYDEYALFQGSILWPLAYILSSYVQKTLVATLPAKGLLPKQMEIASNEISENLRNCPATIDRQMRQEIGEHLC